MSNFIIIILLIFVLVVMFISLAYAVYYVFKVFFSYKYEYKPTSAELNDYYISIKDYYEKYPDVSIDIEELYENYMLNAYCKCNETNTKNNDIKSSFLFKTRMAIVIALIAFTFALVVCNIERAESVYNNVKLNYKNIREVEEVECQQTRTDTTTAAPATTTTE